jgi:2-amino-4-hydroxy-6-hydroxymethyldihydropteridine diphosphokinase
VIYILLGTNLGNKKLNLSNAIAKLSVNRINSKRTSSLYKTAAWGNTNQDYFLNQILEIDTDIDPIELLKICLKVEQDMGRIRNKKWESRVIDIDVLFYNDLILESNELTIPHKHLHQRLFTLLPMAELNPTLIHPVFNKTILELIQNCEDDLPVEKLVN